jgi:hypothetical protein
LGPQNSESPEKSFVELTSQLLRAGYSETSWSRDSKSYCDALAFGAKADGTYGVVAVIEFKRNCDEKARTIAAAGLLLAKEMHDADFAFLKCGDEMYQLVSETRTFDRIIEIPALDRTSALVKDAKVAKHLLWKEMNRRRGSQDANSALISLFEEISVLDGEVLWANPALRIEGSVFAETFLKAIEALGHQNSLSQSIGSQGISAVFEALAAYFPNAQRIFDPASGLGFSLAAVARSINSLGQQGVTVGGLDINPQSASIANKVLSLFGLLESTEIAVQDMAETQWPTSDLLVCEPPLGLRLQERVALGTGSIVQLEDYAIYRSAMQLRSGDLKHGAILVTGRSWLWRNNTQSLRDYLAENNLVRALIGIPPLKSSTSLELLVVVLGHGSGDVAVAELGDDWLAQITAVGGELPIALRRSFNS